MEDSKVDAEKPSPAEPTEAAGPELGTIARTAQMLARWGRTAPHGLARVEFVSEPARLRVVDMLRTACRDADVPFTEVALPAGQPPEQVVHDLKERFRALPPGVVSLSGFETAFRDGPGRIDALGTLNFNRENLALHPLRQIWWMTPLFIDTFVQVAPDLNSWFILRLQLNEVVLAEEKPVVLGRGVAGDFPVPAPAERMKDARRRSAGLARRFETALKAGASLRDLLELALPAVEALFDAGDPGAARSLQQRLFERLAASGRPVGGLPLEQVSTPAEARACANLLARLAHLYQRVGDVVAAEALFSRAIALREEHLAFDPSALAIALRELALFYNSQGRSREAEPLLRRAVAIQEREAGTGSPAYATALSALGEVLQRQGSWDEAERLLREAIGIQEHAIGSEPVDRVQSLYRLALSLSSQGRYAEATALLEQALVMTEALSWDAPQWRWILLLKLIEILQSHSNGPSDERLQSALSSYASLFEDE